MTILEKNKELFGTKVLVTCRDSKTFTGVWSEWFDEKDNEWRKDESGLPACESILIEQNLGPVEIFIKEIASIEKVIASN